MEIYRKGRSIGTVSTLRYDLVNDDTLHIIILIRLIDGKTSTSGRVLQHLHIYIDALQRLHGHIDGDPYPHREGPLVPLAWMASIPLLRWGGAMAAIFAISAAITYVKSRED
jgi:hypothetical protein